MKGPHLAPGLTKTVRLSVVFIVTLRALESEGNHKSAKRLLRRPLDGHYIDSLTTNRAFVCVQ